MEKRVRMRAKFWTAGLTVGFVICRWQDALALTKEEAIENCRATVGRPIVQSCMAGGRGNSR
jgi:hypothetical protein